MTRLTSCADPEAVAVRAAEEISRHLRQARERSGVAHIALSGGTSPERTYELLARKGMDWSAIELWFADERCVPPEHEDSNYALVARTLLEPGGVPAGRVHRMPGELGPEEGAERYAEMLRTRLPRASSQEPSQARSVVSAPLVPGRNASENGAARMPVLDVVVLGIGPDGHIASLFADAATLDAGTDALCLGVADSPKPPPERITLSLAMLRAAARCVLLATGAGKADSVCAMLGQPSRHVPASLLRRERLTVILDDAAAARTRA